MRVPKLPWLEGHVFIHPIEARRLQANALESRAAAVVLNDRGSAAVNERRSLAPEAQSIAPSQPRHEGSEGHELDHAGAPQAAGLSIATGSAASRRRTSSLRDIALSTRLCTRPGRPR